MRLSISALVFVCLLLPSVGHAQEASVADLMARVEAAQEGAGPEDLGRFSIEELLAELNVPGVSVAVIKDFRVQWEKGYGVADVETGAPVDAETMFQAASISKPVTAMAVVKAAEDGLFTLDTDINDILTSWTLDGAGFTDERPVTPRTLHSHTAGLGDGFGYPGYEPDGTIPTALQTLDGEGGSNTRRIFMERPPMTATEYSGGGLTLMQVALSDARGKAFEDIMRDDVLAPIGMTRSSFEQPISPENDRNAARGHGGEGEAMGPKWHVYPEMAAAGLWTTAGDLARLAVEVQNAYRGESDRVISRAGASEMLSPVGVGGFAVGFVISNQGEGWYFSHGGGNWGFICTLVAHKVKGYGLAIMTNSFGGGAAVSEISRRIRRHYEWDWDAEPVPRGYDPIPEIEEIEVDPQVLARYEGTYELEDDQRLLVLTVDEGRLRAELEGQPTLTFYAETEERFFLKVAPVAITFETDGSGQVTGLVVHQGGEETAARKIG